jgi:hypothetical protein
MSRSLLGLLALLVLVGVATAEPPSDDRVIRAATLPAGAGCFITKNKLTSGLLLPIPRLGFVQLPVEVWTCDVHFTPPRAPAGAPQVRVSGRFITLAD